MTQYNRLCEDGDFLGEKAGKKKIHIRGILVLFLFLISTLTYVVHERTIPFLQALAPRRLGAA